LAAPHGEGIHDRGFQGAVQSFPSLSIAASFLDYIYKMDRSWIHGKKFTPAYTNGVNEFMEFVKERFVEHIPISCPCRQCLNQIERPQ